MNLSQKEIVQSDTIQSIEISICPTLKLRELETVTGTHITVVEHSPLNHPVNLLITHQTLTLCDNKAAHMKLSAAAIGGKR
jgi:hypothetical protein